MKILLDENLPHELRRLIVGHDVYTVPFQGWRGVKNGLLLTLAGAAGFDVMITKDSGVPYQQNSVTLPIAVVVLKAESNDIEDIRPLIPGLLEALDHVVPRTIVWVG